MPQGLQCWGPGGSQTLDITNRLVKIIGVVITNGQAGSINVWEFAQGTGWFYPSANDDTLRYTPPQISINGVTLSWGASATGFRITYGIY